MRPELDAYFAPAAILGEGDLFQLINDQNLPDHLLGAVSVSVPKFVRTTHLLRGGFLGETWARNDIVRTCRHHGRCMIIIGDAFTVLNQRMTNETP